MASRDPYPPETIQEIKLDIEESRREYSKLKRKAEAELRRLVKRGVRTRRSSWVGIDASEVCKQDTLLVSVCREEALLNLLEQRMSSDGGLSEYEAQQILCGDGNAEPMVLAWDTLRSKTRMKMMTEQEEEEGVRRGSSCCCICMEEMLVGTVTPCSHTFHGQCLFKWLSGPVGSKSGSCPMCRHHFLLHSPILGNMIPIFCWIEQLKKGRQRILPHHMFRK